MSNAIKDFSKDLLAKTLKEYDIRKVKPINDRIDNIISNPGDGTVPTEVIDARVDASGVTHANLKKRLDSDSRGPVIEHEVVGSFITVKDTVAGPIKDLQILGSTYQNPDKLDEIVSAGVPTSDGRYEMSILSCGKNLISNTEIGEISSTGQDLVGNGTRTSFCKVKELKTYTMSRNGVKRNCVKIYYDSKKNFISRIVNPTDATFTVPIGVSYVRLTFGLGDETQGCQLEEGTVATPYVPHESNKSSILMPIQLGNGDRLYYCDVEKAWCIDKVETKLHSNDAKKVTKALELTSTIRFDLLFDGVTDGEKVICNKLIWEHSNSDKPHCWQGDASISVFINKSELSSLDSVGAKKWLSDNGVYFIIKAKTPQKIILPLSTQIVLNSFFGITHLSVESGKAQATLKAKVSKSISASVESLGIKTNILTDRVEAIEGMKESQNIAYATEKGYQLCLKTVNSMVSKFKLKGRTLVNLWGNKPSDFVFTNNNSFVDGVVTLNSGVSFSNGFDKLSPLLKPNTNYTIVLMVLENTLTLKKSGFTLVSDHNQSSFKSSVSFDTTIPKGVYMIKVTSKDDLSSSVYGCRSYISADALTGLIKYQIVVLEGDHTQNPPSYFEGMQSVGHGANEIEVLSVSDGNLSDGVMIKGSISSTGDVSVGSGYDVITKDIVNVTPGIIFNYKSIGARGFRAGLNTIVAYYDKHGKFMNIKSKVTFEKFIIPSGCYGVRIRVADAELSTSFKDEDYKMYSHQMTSGNSPSVAKAHKKHILYKNDAGEWTKLDALREWDTAEETNDGYRLTVNSGEVVLDGSESWSLHSTQNQNDTISFQCLNVASDSKPSTKNDSICDKFKWKDVYANIVNEEGLMTHLNVCRVSIFKSKLTTQDVAGFKKWLQANNVKVVYQLAEPKVYEVNNLALEAYANETAILLSSGAINASMEFEVVSHIGNLINGLKTDVFELQRQMLGVMLDIQPHVDSTSIVGNKLTLTNAKYQKATLANNTQIVLPTVDKFAEIHLFFNTTSDLTLVFPSGIKWQTVPTIKANCYYEFIFTYVDGVWHGGYLVHQ